jgi:hypothetical protein
MRWLVLVLVATGCSDRMVRVIHDESENVAIRMIACKERPAERAYCVATVVPAVFTQDERQSLLSYCFQVIEAAAWAELPLPEPAATRCHDDLCGHWRDREVAAVPDHVWQRCRKELCFAWDAAALETMPAVVKTQCRGKGP